VLNLHLHAVRQQHAHPAILQQQCNYGAVLATVMLVVVDMVAVVVAVTMNATAEVIDVN